VDYIAILFVLSRPACEEREGNPLILYSCMHRIGLTCSGNSISKQRNFTDSSALTRAMYCVVVDAAHVKDCASLLNNVLSMHSRQGLLHVHSRPFREGVQICAYAFVTSSEPLLRNAENHHRPSRWLLQTRNKSDDMVLRREGFSQR